MLQGEGVKWSEEPKATESASDLFMAIKTVRNNLLHGDKGYASERDIRLIKASLFVLNRAFEAMAHDAKFQRVVNIMHE